MTVMSQTDRRGFADIRNLMRGKGATQSIASSWQYEGTQFAVDEQLVPKTMSNLMEFPATRRPAFHVLN
jgi:hypothetical protein